VFQPSEIEYYIKLFKRKWYSATGRSYPHLLSIHIPKTAGRTFREILKSQYGVDGVLSLDHHYLTKHNEQLADHPTDQYPVIHGHLPYQQISKVALPSSRYITWLRHPVDRVISNYYYYKHSVFPAKLKRNPSAQLISIEDFIKRPKRRNIINQYLEGINLEALFFVGFQEQFNEDVVRLGRKLHWRISELPLQLRVNENERTKQSAPSLSEELIMKIRKCNEKDLALYEKAKQLSEQGFWS